MIRHAKNQGYGAAQKSGYLHILHSESWQHITHIAMVHGDDQYDIHSIWFAAQADHSIQLGSRHLEPAPPEYPWWRKWGNHALTGFANRTFECSYSDLHTGARIYSREFLFHLPWDKLSDDFVFDHQLLSIAMAQGVSHRRVSLFQQIMLKVSQAFPFVALYSMVWAAFTVCGQQSALDFEPSLESPLSHRTDLWYATHLGQCRSTQWKSIGVTLSGICFNCLCIAYSLLSTQPYV